MKKVYTLVRLCKGHGGGIAVPQGTFSTPEASEDAKRAANLKFQQLMQCQLILPTGPESGEPIGMNVQQFLAFLGIENIEFFGYDAEVHESALLEVPAAGRIIVPN